jgi:hypothetical protein
MSVSQISVFWSCWTNITKAIEDLKQNLPSIINSYPPCITLINLVNLSTYPIKNTILR